MDRKAIVGGIEQINLAVYGNLFGHLTRALRTLGIRREQRMLTLEAHVMASRAAQQQSHELKELVVVDEDLVVINEPVAINETES
jgi:hypothetical protein